MRGRYFPLVWQSDATIYAPAIHRRACRYEAYLPFPLADMVILRRRNIATAHVPPISAVDALTAVW